MNVDVSRDGTALTFDLLGDVYLLSIEGGLALRLTSGPAWDQAPRFSHDGRYIYFVSDRVGAKNIWRLALADRSLQQITHSDSDILGGPNWSQRDGSLVAGVGDAFTRNTEVILHSIDPSTGIMTPIDEPGGTWIDMDTFEAKRPAIKVFSGVEASNGEVFFSQAKFDEKLDRSTVRLYKVDRRTGRLGALTPSDAPYNDYKPQLSHDGRLMAYFRQYLDRRTEIRIRNQMTGQDEALIGLTNADDASYSPSDDSRPNYAFTPTDRHLIFWHAGKLHRVYLANRATEVVPFRVKVELQVWTRARPPARQFRKPNEVRIVRWPSLSADRQAMAFAASGFVWIMNLETGQIRRLTNSTDFEYMPALSPDGKAVVYTSFAQRDGDFGPGRLLVVDVDGSAPRALLGARNENYLLPKWSLDGTRIAVIREVTKGGVSKTFVGWTDVQSGSFHKVASFPSSRNRASSRIYARFVGFDQTGEHLLFSYPRSGSETVLARARLDGGGYQILATGDADVGGIVPAPDLSSLALTRRDGTVWTVPFEIGRTPVSVSSSGNGSRRVSKSGGYYVSWNGTNHITYGFGKSVYRYFLDRGRLEARPVELSFKTTNVAAQPVAFKGARLITMSDKGVIEKGTILLQGRRIAAVGHVAEVAIPTNARIIEAVGKTILPGLLDTHYHRIGGGDFSALALPEANFDKRGAIAYGITTAWEPGGAVNDGVPAIVDMQRAGRIQGPRWSHSAMGAIGYPFTSLTTYCDALSAVEQHQNLGVSVLKEYNTPTRQQRQWLSTAAQESALGIISHIESFDGMMTRIVDGFTGGDHPYIPIPFYKDVHQLLLQTGYIWTPNIIISSGTIGGYRDVHAYYRRCVLERHPTARKKLLAAASRERPDQMLPKEATVAYSVHRVHRVANQAAAASMSGVHLGISGHNMPGVNLHKELWLLQKGGLQNEEVLRAVTIGNAQKLGLEDEVGSLEPGKLSDLLVLDENPLEDITNMLFLKYTVMDGIVYDSNTTEKADFKNPVSDSEHNVVMQ